MFRFIWLSFLGQPRKHLSVALIFGIDLAQPLREGCQGSGAEHKMGSEHMDSL